MSNEDWVEGSRRALLVVQAALNRLVEDGNLVKSDIVDSINEVFSPSHDTAPEVVVDHPSKAHAILSEFVAGLRSN